jgi:hypothetical protein
VLQRRRENPDELRLPFSDGALFNPLLNLLFNKWADAAQFGQCSVLPDKIKYSAAQ